MSGGLTRRKPGTTGVHANAISTPAKATAMPVEPFRLTALSPEIQLIIFRLALPDHLTVLISRAVTKGGKSYLIYRALKGDRTHEDIIRFGIHPAMLHHTGLLRISKAIYQTVLEAVYQRHVFVFANVRAFAHFYAQCQTSFTNIQHVRFRTFPRNDMEAHVYSLAYARRLQHIDFVAKLPLQESLVGSLLKAISVFINVGCPRQACRGAQLAYKQKNLDKICFVGSDGVPLVEYRDALIKLLTEQSVLPTGDGRHVTFQR